MTAIALPAPAHVRVVPVRTDAGSWGPRFVLAGRFVSLVYLFMIAFLLLGTLVPVIALGWQPLAVVSGSMQPALQPGSVVLVQPARADQFYANPTILAYDDPAAAGHTVTHRVVETHTDDRGAVRYTTKGDANHVVDSSPVAHGAVTGAVRMVVPFVALPALWLTTGESLSLVAVAAMTLMALATMAVRVSP